MADRVGAETVALGDAGEAAELSARVSAGEAAGAIVLAPAPGPELGPLPARRRVAGVARFAPRARVFDEHTVFAGGRPVVRTRVGTHATLIGERVLAVGADLVGRWGRLGAYWALGPIGDFLVELTGRPLLKLAPAGCLRLDDAPGTAQMQLEGRAKDDRAATRRLQGSERDLPQARRAAQRRGRRARPRRRRAGPARAGVAGGDRGAAKRGRGGRLRTGLSRLAALRPHAPRPRRRSSRASSCALDEAEAGRRIDARSLAGETLGARARTFVAPAWGYSDGALAAAARRSLPAWHRAAPEPLLVDGNPRETLIGPGGSGRRVTGSTTGRSCGWRRPGVPPTPGAARGADGRPARRRGSCATPSATPGCSVSVTPTGCRP